MLLVQRNGSLDSLVADDVSLGKVFGKDARTRLIFLLDGVALLVLGFSGRGGFLACHVVEGMGACHLDGRRAQLGVVEEESGLSSSVREVVS